MAAGDSKAGRLWVGGAPRQFTGKSEWRLWRCMHDSNIQMRSCAVTGDGRYVCPSLMNERCTDLRLADLYSLAATVYAVVGAVPAAG